VVIFGEFVLANFFKRKGICDIIFFYQIFFARWKKIQHLKNCFFQVEELEKIKLETTYPSYIRLLFPHNLPKDGMFQIFDPVVP
jgi:hypothetical protein